MTDSNDLGRSMENLSAFGSSSLNEEMMHNSDDIISWFMLNFDVEQTEDSTSEMFFSGLGPVNSPSIARSDTSGSFTHGDLSDGGTIPSSASKTRSGHSHESVHSDSEDERFDVNDGHDRNSDSSSDDGDGSKSRDSSKASKRRKTKSNTTAQESRKRQRVTIETLERAVKSLTEENDGLQEHIQMVTRRKAEVIKHRTDMERIMARQVLEKDDIENNTELQQMVKNYRDVYADYGMFRKKEV